MKNILNKIKNFFKNIAEKFKSFVKKVADKVNDVAQNHGEAIIAGATMWQDNRNCCKGCLGNIPKDVPCSR